MTKTIKWRLGKLPDPLELQGLVRDEIITKEEAREILFSTEELEDRKALEAEIKFLRQLVDKLANNSKIVETIRYIEKPYYKWNWYQPYATWCSSIPASSYTVTSGSSGTSTANTVYSLSSQVGGSTNASATVGSQLSQLSTLGKNFSEIETF